MRRMWVAWWRRHRSNRQAKFFAQHRLNRAAWRGYGRIDDLADTHGKRLLFDGPGERAVSSTRHGKPLSRPV